MPHAQGAGFRAADSARYLQRESSIRLGHDAHGLEGTTWGRGDDGARTGLVLESFKALVVGGRRICSLVPRHLIKLLSLLLERDARSSPEFLQGRLAPGVTVRM